MSSANVRFIPAFGANYSPLGQWGTPLSATRAICSPLVPTSSPYMGTGIIQSMVIIQLSRYFSPLNVPGPQPCLVQSQLQIRHLHWLCLKIFLKSYPMQFRWYLNLFFIVIKQTSIWFCISIVANAGKCDIYKLLSQVSWMFNLSFL